MGFVSQELIKYVTLVECNGKLQNYDRLRRPRKLLAMRYCLRENPPGPQPAAASRGGSSTTFALYGSALVDDSARI